MQLRSDAVRCGTARAPHRSLLKADGITDEEMEQWKKKYPKAFGRKVDADCGVCLEGWMLSEKEEG